MTGIAHHAKIADRGQGMLVIRRHHAKPFSASLPRSDTSMEATQKSHTKMFEPRQFRARFAHYWSLFLRENYRNPEEVAVAFGVRYQTALNWWQEAHRPSGDVVALAGYEFAQFMAGRK